MKKLHLRTLLFYAFKDLTRNFRMVLMVAVALAFSLLGFFVSSSLLAGFRQILQNSVINTYGHIIVKPTGDDKYIGNASGTFDILKEQAHVTGIAARLELPLQVSYQDFAVGTLGAGVVEAEENSVSVLSKNIIEGSFFPVDSEDSVVIGKSIADDLDGATDDGKAIEVGSKVEITTSAGRLREYTVSGIIDTKNIVSNRYVYFSRKETENLLSLSDEVSSYLLKVDGVDAIPAVKTKLNDLKLPIHVYAWDEQALYIQDIINTFSVVSNLINAISLFAAATVMFVVISINTERKRKEIATLRSLGTDASFIIAFFIVEAVIYTLSGMLVGAPLFYAIHRHFATKPLILVLGDLRTVINFSLIFWSAFLFFVVTLIAGIYPAWRAAKKVPIRILWRG